MAARRIAVEPVPPVLPIGAAFGVPIAGKRFGLCRVIARARAEDAARVFSAAGSAVLVLATRWTGTRAQLRRALADPRARQPLRLTHHTWRDKPYVVLVTEPPPASFVSLGELAPSRADARLRNAYFAWATLPLQYQAQLAWEADPEAVRARDRRTAREQREQLARARTASASRPARARPHGKPASLATLARRAPFADWNEPLRGRARARIARLIAQLRTAERARDPGKPGARLRAIVGCARSFNRERELGTLEAEALDEALLAIACAVGIEPDIYGRAIDEARDW